MLQGPAFFENVALGKTTWQTNTDGGPSSRAVDGDRSPDYALNSCSRTALTSVTEKPVWAVDLKIVSEVQFVEVTISHDYGSQKHY